MAFGSTTTYSGGILKTQFDYSKLFVWNNRYRTATYTNPSGSAAATLSFGMLIGRISASSKILPQVSTATDGSQVPIGVLRGNYVVPASGTITITYCYTGDVDFDGLVFGGSDLLTTVITLNDSASTPNTVKIGTIEDLLVARGINPIATTDNTTPDN